MTGALFYVSIALITFIPIFIWGYFVSYLDGRPLQKKRFGLGIFAGAIAVIPILYLEQMIDYLGATSLNIFYYISHLSDTLGGVRLFLSFLSILLFFSLIPFLLFYLRSIFDGKFKVFLQRFLVFSLYFAIISVFFYLINKVFDIIPSLNPELGNSSLSFGYIVFDSLKLVILYYIVIAILEELSKFLFFSYDKNFGLFSLKDGVMSAVYIALGFSFMENLLYFINIYNSSGISNLLIGTYFIRNITSVFIHVLASSIFAYYFSYVYTNFKSGFDKNFIKILFLGFMLAILIHSLYDIFILFNLNTILFFYMIAGYFYFTYLLYKK